MPSASHVRVVLSAGIVYESNNIVDNSEDTFFAGQGPAGRLDTCGHHFEGTSWPLSAGGSAEDAREFPQVPECTRHLDTHCSVSNSQELQRVIASTRTTTAQTGSFFETYRLARLAYCDNMEEYLTRAVVAEPTCRLR